MWPLRRYYYLVTGDYFCHFADLISASWTNSWIFTMLHILRFKDTICSSVCVQCVSVLDAKRQKERRLSQCAQNRSYKPLNSTIANWYKGARGKSSHASVPIYSLPARWEAGSTWQMPLGSIIPEGWKDPPHDGKPVKQEETGIPNDKLQC